MWDNLFWALKAIAEYHGFPRDSSGPERGIANFARWLSHFGYHVIVAELDGHIVGGNVLDERSTIVGLGPITIDPSVQNRSIGRQLMQAALQRVAERQAAGGGWSKLPITTGLSPCIRRWASKSASRLSRYKGHDRPYRLLATRYVRPPRGISTGAMQLCWASTAMTGVVNSWML